MCKTGDIWHTINNRLLILLKITNFRPIFDSTTLYGCRTAKRTTFEAQQWGGWEERGKNTFLPWKTTAQTTSQKINGVKRAIRCKAKRAKSKKKWKSRHWIHSSGSRKMEVTHVISDSPSSWEDWWSPKPEGSSYIYRRFFVLLKFSARLCFHASVARYNSLYS